MIILSDDKGVNFWLSVKIAHDYGIFYQQDGISERANIIIDESGLVKWVKVFPPKQLPVLSEVFQILGSQ